MTSSVTKSVARAYAMQHRLAMQDGPGDQRPSTERLSTMAFNGDPTDYPGTVTSGERLAVLHAICRVLERSQRDASGQKLSLAIDCCQPCLTSELRSLVVADGFFESRQSDLLPTAHLALRAQAYDASTLRGGDQ